MKLRWPKLSDESFLYGFVYLTRIGTAFLTGYEWHLGRPDIAIGMAVFFILNAIYGVRERVNYFGLKGKI